MKIDCDFPGGNILVEAIEGDTVRLRQDRRNSTDWWFYWCFRICGTAGRKVRFEFIDGDVFSACGPCYSRDFEEWQWLGTNNVDSASFTHTFAEDEDVAWFSFCFPYTEKHLRQFLASCQEIEVRELTRSEQNRPVELLHIPSQNARGAILLCARTHACETMGSYALEGFLNFWLSSSLRENFDLFAVPFLDKDGVENGDQGKLRAPHDHARDFTTQPLYASTAALMQLIASRDDWFAGIDLHCPWIRAEQNETCFFIGAEQPWQTEIEHFANILAETHQGELSFYATDVFPFGLEWNQGRHETFARHLRTTTNTKLALTVEIPYARARGSTVTRANARAFGSDLARAFVQYSQTSI